MNDLSSYLQIWKKQTDQDKSNLSYLPLPPSYLFSRYMGGGRGWFFILTERGVITFDPPFDRQYSGGILWLFLSTFVDNIRHLCPWNADI